jgi:hypothetical protein
MWEPPEPPEPPSALVVIALKELARICNQHNGFHSDPEKKWAIETLRALRYKTDELLDPRAIRAWAEDEGGWAEREARRLGDYVEGVLNGQKYYSANRLIRRNHEAEQPRVDRWRGILDGTINVDD